VHRRERGDEGLGKFGDTNLDGMTEEEVDQHFKDRYQNRGGYTQEDFTDEASDINPMPSVSDPKLFSIPCRGGKEEETVISIMQKAVNCEAAGEPLKIKSAFYQPSIKGFIYVEAEKEDHCRQAIMGMRTLFHYKMQLVPIIEMSEVMKAADKKHTSLKRNSWVRLKRGKFKGDLAQVVEPDEAQSQAQVRIIPRIDFQALAAKSSGAASALKRKRGSFLPPQKLFNYEEVMAAGGAIDTKYNQQFLKNVQHLASDMYVDGYLIKTVPLAGIRTEAVNATIEELQMFEDRGGQSQRDGGEEGDAVASSLSGVENIEKRKQTYLRGDLIKVIEGDLKNLKGEVLEVDKDADTITIQPHHAQLTEKLKLSLSQVQKHFTTGDHVKVIAGRYEGETGMIVKVEEDQVVVFSDLNKKELKVFLVDTQKSDEVATGLDAFGNYALHDLVALGPQAVGVIVRVDRQSFSVINNNGVVQEIKVQAIGQKKNSRNAVALDGNQNQLSVGDLVKCTDGPNKEKSGTVQHLFRSFAFLHSNDVIKNAGIFVVRARQCVLVGGQARQMAMMGGYGSAGGTPGGSVLYSPAHGMGAKGGKGGKGGGMMGMKGGGKGGMRNDHLVNRKMMITRGPYKGYEGLVKEATDTVARVELHSKMKVVPVNVQDLKDLDSTGRANFGMGGVGGAFGQGPDMRPPPTPAYAPNTPSQADMMATPSRDATMTPGRWDEAWDPNAATGSTPGYTPGTGTPGYTPGSEGTPGYGSARPTPGTPGEGYTPGMGPSTPGGGFTPGEGYTPASVQPGYTPGGPSTPGGSGHTPANPATPGGFDGYGDDDAVEWLAHAEQAAVRVTGGEHANREGVVLSKLAPGGSSVSVLIGGETVNVAIGELERVPPGKKDQVKVVTGQLAGETGTLIGIDGEDGIVKMDANTDIKILDLESLCKLLG